MSAPPLLKITTQSLDSQLPNSQLPSSQTPNSQAPNSQAPNSQTPDSCLPAHCPIQFVLDILGNKWSLLVLRELFLGQRRTHELLAALPGISSKTLTIRLRDLENHGLVERQVYPEVPPRVVYGLTAKGKQLQPVMAALQQVGEQWMAKDHCTCPLVGDLGVIWD